MYMILYVASDLQQARGMLDVWVHNGVGGVTILESHGMQQLIKKGLLRDDLGPIPSLRSLFRAQESHHRTIFSVIKDDETLQHILKVSEEYVGDWGDLDVGVLFVWPVLHAFGLDKNLNN